MQIIQREILKNTNKIQAMWNIKYSVEANISKQSLVSRQSFIYL